MRRWCLIDVLTDAFDTRHSLEVQRHLFPISSMNALVAPFQVILWGRIYHRWVVRSDSEVTRCCHKFSSPWAAVVMLAHLPIATISAF